MLLSLSVFLLSASVLYYEIVLVRLLALSHWQPFVTLGISTALLGFGISGTILMGTRNILFPKRRIYYPLLASLTALSLRPVLSAAGSLRLEPGLIIRDPSQWLNLGLLVSVLFIPFILSSLALALPLLEKETVGKYYGWNLAGACAGVFLALLGMEHLDPSRLAMPAAAISALACSASLVHYYGKPLRMGGLSMILLLPLALYPSKPISFGPYKDISYGLLLPESRVVLEEWGTNGMLQVILAPSIRSASGLSMRYRGGLPDQGALYRDGDRIGTLILTNDETDKNFEYLKWQTAAAPYSLLMPGAKVVLVGFDGGEGAVRARVHEVASVAVVEPDRSVGRLVREHPDLFRSWIFSSDIVSLVPSGARSFFYSGTRENDAVIYPISGNMASASAGISGAAENYELTVEGVMAALETLNPNGLVAIAGWNQAPSTGRWKILNLLMAVPGLFKDDGFTDRVCLVTSWSTHIFIIKNKQFKSEELSRLGRFCDSRGFSIKAGKELADLDSGHGWDTSDFWDGSFDLRPPRDSRPYPWHTLKASSLRHLLGGTREEVFPRVEWGFFFLIMTLILSCSFAVILLVVSRPRSAGSGASIPFFLYFTCLGIGYMVIEILLIKKSGIVLAPPAVAAAYVLAPFLFFSGLGSHTAGRTTIHPLRTRAVFLLIIPCGYAAYAALELMPSIPGPARLFLNPLLMAPAAFFMGMPFPLALKSFPGRRETLVPWAWAISGYMSVVGSSLAGVLAVTAGFGALLLLGMACYLLAALLFGKVVKGC
jgi:hypothetical protein